MDKDMRPREEDHLTATSSEELEIGIGLSLEIDLIPLTVEFIAIISAVRSAYQTSIQL